MVRLSRDSAARISIRRALDSLGASFASQHTGLVGLFPLSDQLVLTDFELACLVEEATKTIEPSILSLIDLYARENGAWPSFAVLSSADETLDPFFLKSTSSEFSIRLADMRDLTLAQRDKIDILARYSMILKKMTSKHAVFVSRRERSFEVRIKRPYWEHFLSHIPDVMIYSGALDRELEPTNSWKSLHPKEKGLFFQGANGKIFGVISPCPK